MGPEFIAVLIPFGAFAMVAFIVWNNTQSRRQRMQAMVEVQSRMIDRFGSAAEFTEFLQSPAGRSMIGDVPQMRRTSHDTILRSVRAGIIAGLIGIGFLVVTVWEYNHGFIIAGCVLTAIGVGNLISAFVSYRMMKSWGLLDQNQSQTI